jgi:electron transfer flavoprotein beta subunit
MKAKSKQLSIQSITDFSFNPDPGFNIIEVTAPPKRKSGIKVDSVEALVDKLRHEAKVLA